MYHYACNSRKKAGADMSIASSAASATDPIELTIKPRIRSLGEFDVRRVLPAAERRMVGPFVFLDHMGPAVFPPGQGIAVRPHPHIGLATITYLFEGEIVHRDSLGYEQLITAGAVNLMTAGRGIVHSERASDDIAATSRLHGIQSWLALPTELEEMPPSFFHTPAVELPEVAVGNSTVRVIMGSAFDAASPVVTYSSTLYLEARLPQGAELTLPPAAELAAYVASGSVHIAGQEYPEGALAVARSGAEVTLRGSAESRVMILGGEPLGHRHIWWNFVSSDKERIEQAKRDWGEGRMTTVPGDEEFIPLPER
jgi:redox-sensitive bicupin YhaK (pirin superfamily)